MDGLQWTTLLKMDDLGGFPSIFGNTHINLTSSSPRQLAWGTKGSEGWIWLVIVQVVMRKWKVDVSKTFCLYIYIVYNYIYIYINIYIYTQGRPKNIGSIQWSVSESTILLVKVYDQQFQGTILLMVFDLQVCI